MNSSEGWGSSGKGQAPARGRGCSVPKSHAGPKPVTGCHLVALARGDAEKRARKWGNPALFLPGQGRCAEGEGPAQPSPRQSPQQLVCGRKAGGKISVFWDVFKLFISQLGKGIEGTLVA